MTFNLHYLVSLENSDRLAIKKRTNVLDNMTEELRIVSDLRYLPNRYQLPFATHGSHWRRDTLRKPRPPKLDSLAPTPPPR
jgi:CRISPR/Cas system CSM-associated protein Csm4 (group 5 of RAMP superfamily)